MIQFDLPKQKSSIIKVLGVGGGGSNAVNFMFNQDIAGVDFIICNTDSKAIEQSTVPNKIQLGPHLTQGLGAGADPSVGKLATEESLDEIRKILEVNTRMAFITVGMGGGTGTGGAPIIAKICKDLGILTVGIVTTPFGFEGPRRQAQAEEGIKQLKPLVDTLLVISNDKLRVQYGNLKMKEAFTKADNVLATAAKCITDVINSRGHIIVDFADVCTVMKNGGVAILGKAEVEGENRAQRAIEEALNSPLLNDNDIRGAKWILLNINSAEGDYECSMDELETINNFLRERTGENSDVIMGMGYDSTLGQKLGITLIATGFEHKDPFQKQTPKKAEAPVEEKIVMTLLTEDSVNETNNLKSAPTEAVAETPAEEPKTEEPTIGDSYFTLGEEVVEAIDEVAAIVEEEVEEEMSIHEVDEISEKEYEAEIDAQISIAANEVMEEMVSQPIVFEINDVYEGEDVEEQEEVVVNEVEEEQLEEEVIVSELAAPVAETNHFILTKPTNIYAEHTEEEPSLEEFEEMEEEEMEEEEMEDQEMEEMLIQDDLTVTMQEIVEEELVEEIIVEQVTPEMIEEEKVEEELVEVAEITMQAAPVQESVVYESSFRMEEEPTMQLVMRDESSFNANQNNAKQHPSSFDMPMDDAEEQRKKVAERIQKLRNLSFNISNASDPNNEFDAVPAYVRRNLDLFGNTMASVENYYSKYTVEKDENNQTQISTINTFLDGKKPD
ncbi:MAG: cell division protein FtsZ [Chitinophagia bacterium]|nr:cell division protein FtsZ [Chitinophagia bacterium]